MSDMFKPVDTTLPAKQTFWSRCKAFWLQDAREFLNQEVKITLTPGQKKFEEDLNAFLHQEITWQQIHDFLFQEITFGKKKNKEVDVDVANEAQE